MNLLEGPIFSAATDPSWIAAWETSASVLKVITFNN
jgi:hypothetical protein